jgi:hemerythrin-like domain-containing protein
MHDEARRRFLVGTAGTGLLMAACGQNGIGRTNTASQKTSNTDGDESDEDVSPPEDLMREHGVLNRILLIYDESARRLDTAEALPIEVVASSASIIRRFIEDYHERLEENFLFPRFEKANQLVELVATLRRQHQAGRQLTDVTLRLANAASIERPSDRADLASTLRRFVRMYRPHEAREDTVLFPALRRLVKREELGSLGEQFEKKEHELFGKEGFEGIVEQIASLERKLGTYELDLFTPA